MVGGTTLGYCAIGSRSSETVPTSTKTIASTFARTGRSMKNFEIIAARYDLPLVIVVSLGETFSPGIARARPLTIT